MGSAISQSKLCMVRLPHRSGGSAGQFDHSMSPIVEICRRCGTSSIQNGTSDSEGPHAETRAGFRPLGCIFEYFRGTNAALRRPLVRAGQQRGATVISKRYLMRQARALISFAKSTNNPELAAVLVERAADFKDQVDKKTPPFDPSPRAPDVQPSRN